MRGRDLGPTPERTHAISQQPPNTTLHAKWTTHLRHPITLGEVLNNSIGCSWENSITSYNSSSPTILLHTLSSDAATNRMNYENYTQSNAAPPLPLKTPEPYPPTYIKSTSASDKDRGVKIASDDLGFNNAPWLLRRTSIQISSEPAEPYDNDRGSVSQLSTATTKRSSEKDGGLRRKLFKQAYSQGHSRNSESISDGRTSSSWQHTEAFDTGFGTQVSIEAGRPRRKEAERQYDMKGLEQAASIKRWGGGGKPGEAWGKLQRVSDFQCPLKLARC